MDLIPLQEKRKYKIYINSGALEQSDIDDAYDQIKENYTGYLEDMKRFS
jgi:hypothetical protein